MSMTSHEGSVSISGSSSLSANAQQIRRLEDAQAYYSAILKPQYDKFFAEEATLLSAFNLANALFHFHEWLFASHKAELAREFGARTVKTHQAFWKKIQDEDNRFGFIRDVANSAKHMILTLRPSTSMTHIANTFLVVAASPPTLGRAGQDRVKMQDESTQVDFDDCAKKLFDRWTSLARAVGLKTDG
jgi:hypothetical protein